MVDLQEQDWVTVCSCVHFILYISKCCWMHFRHVHNV
uniref:Uncharacterized protein n=1 Tax=Anguilla anguilla TaxID=7936 RepID=A0A0E9XSC8_ANGAN